MNRRGDNAPVGNTCPKINVVISILENDVVFDEETGGPHEAIKIMEEIREANLELRNWGNELYREKEAAEKEIEQLQRQVEALDDELKSIQSEQQ